MKISSRIAIALIACGALTACVTPRAYVDPQYHRATYEAIQRPSEPTLAKVETRFQRNGERHPAADAEFRGHVERTLRATGVFTPSSALSAATEIDVTVNNIADIAAARAKGFGTGLTLGVAGSMVEDNYEFTFSYRGANGQGQESTYLHAIHTAIGKTAEPAGVMPTSLSDAFGKVVEDVTLNFVKDLQDKNSIQE